MGTPASVVSEPPLWQVSTEARGRKQASANIFQDAELVQIQGLFQRSGDQLAEERAQIIWECAGDHRVAEALRRLREKRPRGRTTAAGLECQSLVLQQLTHRTAPLTRPPVSNLGTPGGQVPESKETGISQTPQVTSTRSDTDPVKRWGALWNTAGMFVKGLMELQKET